MAGTVEIKKTISQVIETVFELTDFAAAETSMAKIKIIIGLADNAVELAGLDIKALKAEFQDLDAAEKADLANYFKIKFDLKDDVLEQKIEKAFDWILKAEELINGAIELKGLYA